MKNVKYSIFLIRMKKLPYGFGLLLTGDKPNVNGIIGQNKNNNKLENINLLHVLFVKVFVTF